MKSNMEKAMYTIHGSENYRVFNRLLAKCEYAYTVFELRTGDGENKAVIIECDAWDHLAMELTTQLHDGIIGPYSVD